MPVATSSRRRTTRRAPSSDIEDGQGTQAAATQDDVMDEDEDDQPVVRRAKGKKVAVKEVKPVVAHDDDESEDEEVDVSNFQHQALGHEGLRHITTGLVADWTTIATKLKQSWDHPGSVCAAVIEAAGADAEKDTIEEVDSVMRTLIDINAEMHCHEDALNDMHQKLAAGDKIDDIVSTYLEEAQNRVEEYHAKTARQKYAKQDEYKNFRQNIWEAERPHEPMPPLTDDVLPKEPGDDSDEDDDIEIGGVTQDFKCPISLGVLQKPLTSSVCKHTFSSESIKSFFIGSRNGKRKCPAAGCNKEFSLNDCKPDKEMERRVKAHERRQRRLEDENDDGEVVE